MRSFTNQLPPQPPQKSGRKNGSKKSSESTSSSQDQPQQQSSKTREKAPTADVISDTPPPDNPLEEPNIWCEILKLEGRKHSNQVAEGFVHFLKKSIDSTLYEVQNYK